MERSGLGADMKPVPAPTVRDLSVSQPSKAGRGKKPAQPEPVKEPAPADEVEVIPAREVAAATVGDILGKKTEPAEAKPGDAKADGSPRENRRRGKAARAQARTRGGHYRRARHTSQARRPEPKPITVASTPMIGNYQLPPLDFLQHPDPTSSPPSRKRS